MHDRCLKLVLDLMDGSQRWHSAEQRPDVEILLAAGYVTMRDVARTELTKAGDRGFVAQITPAGRRAIARLPYLCIESFAETIERAIDGTCGCRLPTPGADAAACGMAPWEMNETEPEPLAAR